MKLFYRILAMALAVVLLTFCASAAEKTIDFRAIAAEGDVDAHVGVTVTCPPRLGAMYWCEGTEQYAIYQGEDRRYYISDYQGNITFSLPVNVSEAVLKEGNYVVASFSDGGFRVYDVAGRQLSDDRYTLQSDNNSAATGVGDEHVLICNNVTDRTTGKQCFLLIDPSGQNMAAEAFGRFWQGIVACRRDGKWGAQEPFGKLWLPYTYDYLEMANDGVVLCGKGGKYGLIDLEGNTLVPFDYDEMKLLRNDDYRRVAVRQGSAWGVIDLTGRVRVPIVHPGIEETDYMPISGTPAQWYFVRLNNYEASYHLCDDGTVLFDGSPAIPRDVQVLSDGRFIRKLQGETGYELLDSQGKRLIAEKIHYFDVFDGGYYFVVQPLGENRTVGRIYGEDLELKREITGATSGSTFDKYVCFGKTDSVLLVQCFTQDRVELYDYDGNLLDTIRGTYLMNVFNGKTIVLRKHDTYQGDVFAVGTADGKHFTPFQYSFVSPINWEDGSNELVNVGQGRGANLIHNSGTQVLSYQLFDGVRLLTGAGSGPAMFRVGNQCGFLYVAPPPLCFADVNDNDWFADAVGFCVSAGLMRGVGNARFAPRTAMTRAMLVQVLYNLSGEPSEPFGFVDVADGAWYADAVNWAADNEIVNGMSPERFEPNAPVTREQMVTILRRYAMRFVQAEGTPDALDGFADRTRVSAYAEEAMCWAVSSGLINGRTPTTLEPKGQAQRSEIATVLMRFVKLMAADSE